MKKIFILFAVSILVNADCSKPEQGLEEVICKTKIVSGIWVQECKTRAEWLVDGCKKSF